MNNFQALLIKLWRVKYDYSWRAVHSAWQVRYLPKEEWWYNPAMIELRETIKSMPNKPSYLDFEDGPDGSQIVGMELCSEAMKYLGEEVEDGWN